MKTAEVILDVDTEYSIFYKVTGNTENVYFVRYDKFKKTYSCACRGWAITPNFECYHIKAVKEMIQSAKEDAKCDVDIFMEKKG